MVPGEEAVCAVSAGVSLVIPVWNRGDLLRKLLISVAAQTTALLEVIVVDNGSTDEAPQIAQDWGARVIEMGRNAGFAAAANRGIQESRGEWIALVNSDVELDPDWLRMLLANLETTGAWMGTGQIRMASDPGRLDGTWDLIARSGCAWRAGFGRPGGSGFDAARMVALIPATAAVYRRELFARVGGFAEVYESYLEDVDFSLRCAAAGFAGVYAPAALCTHQGSASTSPWSAYVTRRLARNQVLLVRRLFPRPLLKKWALQIVLGQLFWGLLAARRGRLLPWLAGKSDGLRMWAKVASLDLDPIAMEEQVTRSEKELRLMQRQQGYESYWRLYFRYTSGELE